MRCLHITDARLLRKTARLPDYSKENFAMAFDSFLMKRFSTTLCSLADEERPGSEMHVVVLQSDHKCSHQCLDQRVDTLIAAKLPEARRNSFLTTMPISSTFWCHKRNEINIRQTLGIDIRKEPSRNETTRLDEIREGHRKEIRTIQPTLDTWTA
ncbi:hypothetical protein HGM15179_016147 [Zosterops borbonicus]|uniref:Uncharacterized protein n=1 Tax=Zosterops borbonicus TaxID=364589 RepID=A0A8K1G3H6_9PASS|nr:hypothetical protein HGM15179_016147 [Zosterops borbonicus]